MSRKPRRSRKQHAPAAPRDTPAAEAITACWMLALFMALATQLAAVAAQLAVRAWPDGANLQILAGLLWFGAVIVAAALLLLTVLVVRIRREPPPRPLIVAGGLLGATPIVLMLLRLAGLA